VMARTQKSAFKHLSARSGEREGPTPQAWEGEVCLRSTGFAARTPLTLPSPPASGWRGAMWTWRRA